MSIPYFDTWRGPSANLECRSEMCCTRLAGNAGPKKDAKKWKSAHHRTTLSGYISATKTSIDNRKKLLNSNISSTGRHNMMNVDPLTAETGCRVWAPQQISTGFGCWLRYCTDVAQRTSTKLCSMFGRLPGWYAIYTFSGALGHGEFCQVQHSPCVQDLRSPILAALLHGTGAVGVSQTLRRGTRNGIKELL